MLNMRHGVGYRIELFVLNVDATVRYTSTQYSGRRAGRQAYQ